MDIVPGYTTVEQIHDGGMAVARAERRHDGLRAVIKWQHNHALSTDQRARLQHEFRLLQFLQERNADNLVRPVELVVREDRTALVLHDLGGYALNVHMAQKAASVQEVLHIAMQVARGLDAMHRARVVHKDITPGNIVWKRGEGVAQIIDLGISSRLVSQSRNSDYRMETMEGTPQYVSPEQTGRMHRAVDHRTDLYALGATLYELLAGHAPFVQPNMLELISMILTQPAPDLQALAPHAPPMLCAIVMRLLAKLPEDRYQSAAGLAHDLQQCGSGEAFGLGQRDRSDRLILSQNLYGRDAPLAALHQAWQDACAGQPTLTLISGEPGVGKSSLVAQLKPQVATQQGWLAAGKYDVLRRHVPLNALSAALGEIVGHILREDVASINLWKRRIQEVVGAVGQALVEIAPAVQSLLGPQKPLVPLGPRETENRLLYVVFHFLHLVSSVRPLALFLDDLQWADTETLKLIDNLLTNLKGTGRLLLVGAYRHEEIQAHTPMARAMEALLDRPTGVLALHLQPLAQADLQALLSASLGVPPGAHLHNLVTTVYERTGGNPFFVEEFLKHIWDQGLLNQSAATEWTWDIEAIRLLPITDNVVSFLTSRLKLLDAHAERLLGLVACMGDTFALGLLADIERAPCDQLAQHLWPCVEAGLLIPTVQDRLCQHPEATYRFAHDRVRQAAYERLDPASKIAYAHRIGHALLARCPDPPSPSDLFAVLDPLNMAEPLITDASERARLAQRNLEAGREAQRAMAYGAACTYLQAGLAFLAPLPEHTNSPLSREIQLELAENRYIEGNYEEADRRLNALFDSAQTPVEQALVQVHRVRVLETRGLADQTVDACLFGLNILGFKISRDPNPLLLARMMLLLVLGLRGKTREELMARPEAASPRATIALDLLGNLHNYATKWGKLNMAGLAALYTMHVTLKYGNSRFAPYAFSMTSTAFQSAFRDVKRAVWLRGIADEMGQHRAAALRGMFTAVAACFDFLFYKPIDLYETCYRAYSYTVAEGDWSSATMLQTTLIGQAEPLDLARAERMADEFVQICEARGDAISRDCLWSLRQACRALMGHTHSPSGLDDDDDQDEQRIASPPQFTLNLGVYLSQKVLISFVNRDFNAAVAACERSQQNNLPGVFNGTIGAVLHSIFAYLALTQHALTLPRPKIAVPAQWRSCRAFIRWVAHMAPDRYGGVWHLFQAEKAAMDGKHALASRLYAQAMGDIIAMEYPSVLCFAYECAGRHHMRLGDPVAARGYLQGAVEAYGAWGATYKVRQLHEEFANVLRAPTPTVPRGQVTQSLMTTTSRNLDEQISIAAVLDASRGLLNETSDDQVAMRALDALTTHTGADNAVMLLPVQQVWTVTGLRGARAAKDVALPCPLDACIWLPQRLLHYVIRTQQRAILSQGDNNPLWDDPYFAAHEPVAVFCTPLQRGPSVYGVVYLESHYAGAHFSGTVLDLIEVLAAQGTIALQSAYFERNLQDEVAVRLQHAQRAQQRLIKEQREAVEMQMAGGFAHEMRNALASSNLVLEALRMNMQQPGDSLNDLLETLALVSKSIQSALSVTDDIMQYANIDRVQLGSDVVDIAQVHRGMLQSLAIDHAVIQYDSAIPADLRMVMKASHLETVLRNLLTNARDAVRQPHVTAPHVDLQVRQAGKNVVITIHDNGAGIPETVKGRLFEPFVSTKGAHGRGLGLGMVKKIVELYGGNVQLHSEPGQGTTAQVTLPQWPS